MRIQTFLAVLLAATLGFSAVIASPDRASAQQPRQRGQRRAAQSAQPSEGTAEGPIAPAPTIADLGTIVPRLQSTNPDEVREAIDLLSVIDRREVVAPLADLLRSGQPDAITDRALEALRGLEDPTSLDVLTEFTRHRRVGARRRAYQAIAAIEDRRVTTLLEQGLRDSDRSVRAAVALALGNIGSRGSVDVLFRAFDRGVVEAAVAIGKLGDGRSVERFSQHLGQQPLSVMLSGYEQFLRRTDIDEDVKVQIVNRLGEVSGRTVREFLAQELTRLGDRDRSRYRQVVQDTLRRIPVDGDTRRTTTVGGPGAPATSTTTGGAQ
ncbi:HEAT repeat domain-containing protein [Sandaracinus amylolyticus]|uniref:HEAT repeat protein n=1 Tax=Sandaracinus amylolyticus TaxID=927083 RepID=A0A0F6YJ28_9BACT|nr:HEAT repeat domain-containing protein [Sandaracinus amylolyticus]AKF06872.1 hypothetical protein DB32_004021 [Sandaracinus amylolyticus]